MSAAVIETDAEKEDVRQSQNGSDEGEFEDEDDQFEQDVKDALNQAREGEIKKAVEDALEKHAKEKEKEEKEDHYKRQKAAIEKKYNEFVEVQKSIITITLWVALSIVAIWTRGLLLSLAAAFVAESLDQAAVMINAVMYEQMTRKTDKVFLTISPLLAVVNSGLVLAAASSSDGVLEQQVSLTILAGLQFVGFLYWAYVYKKDAKHTKSFTDHLISTAGREKTGQSTKTFFGFTNPFDNDIFELVIWAFWAVTFVQVFNWSGEFADESKEMSRKLIVLAIGISANLTWVLTLAQNEQQVTSDLVIEGIWLVARLGTKILPVALELSIEEDVDNPRALTIAAWSSCGLFFLAVCAQIADDKGLFEKPSFEPTADTVIAPLTRGIKPITVGKLVTANARGAPGTQQRALNINGPPQQGPPNGNPVQGTILPQARSATPSTQAPAAAPNGFGFPPPGMPGMVGMGMPGLQNGMGMPFQVGGFPQPMPGQPGLGGYPAAMPFNGFMM